MENAHKIATRCADVLDSMKAKETQALIRHYWVKGELKAVSYETFRGMVLNRLNQKLHERFRRVRPL